MHNYAVNRKFKMSAISVCNIRLPRPRPLSRKFICAPARHCPYKAVYQIWSL